MRKYEFYQLDVFTGQAFTGNALAVFPEADGIGDAEMQRIAREMNLSETVFVLPSEKALRRLRIFTPMRELPLAGHPVVGTWNLLAHLGVVPPVADGLVGIEQELNLGVLPVDIEFRAGRVEQVIMTQAAFEAGAVVTDPDEIEKLAAGLGLRVDDLAIGENLPAQVVSTGIGSLAVPVASLAALGRCRINSAPLTEVYLAYGAVGCFAFTFETKESDSNIHARFFAPDDNIPEDPATGSACGSLSGYLMHHGQLETDGKIARLKIEQGDFIDRPSRIFAEITGEKGNVEKVRIGGRSVIVARGEIFF